ncbi:MAG: DUF481 domain-containing protein [Candidatus Aminicenantes bacterium]|nr:DUF481 domain-containing protein [Candidatus Aminicenantes bacterium]
MRNKAVFFLFLLLNLTTIAISQETEQKPEGWNGDLSLGISLARGNSDNTNISFSFNLKRKFTKKMGWENKGLYILGRSADKIESESYELKSTLKWNHSDRFFTHLEIHGFRDQFKNYDYRILPQLGLGYSVVQSERTEISVTTGITGTFTKYTETGESDYYTGIAAGNHFSWKISPTAEFSQDFNVNADLARFRNYFTQLELSLSAAIAKGWAVKISFIDKFDNGAVGKDIKKNDILFITNLSMKF